METWYVPVTHVSHPALGLAHSVYSVRIWPLIMVSILVQPRHLSPAQGQFPLPWFPSFHPSPPVCPFHSSHQKMPVSTESGYVLTLHTDLQGSQIPLGKSPNPPCDPQGPARPAPITSLPSSLPPLILCHSNTGFLTTLPLHQTCSCPRTFAHVLKCASARPPDGSLSHFLQVLAQMSSLVKSYLSTCLKLQPSTIPHPVLFSPSVLITISHAIYSICLFLSPTMKCTFHEDRVFYVFCSVLDLQYLNSARHTVGAQ